MGEKTGMLEVKEYKMRRLYKELAQFPRRVQHLKKIEGSGAGNEVLREE